MSLSVSLLPSAARTANPTINDIDTQAAVALVVTVDVTAQSGGSITVSINRKDPVSGKYTLLLASTAIVAVSTVVLKVSPMIASAANLIAQDHPTQVVQVAVLHNNGSSITYSVAIDLIRG